MKNATYEQKAEIGRKVYNLILSLGLDHEYSNYLIVPSRYKALLEKNGIDFSLAADSYNCNVEGHQWYKERAYEFYLDVKEGDLKAISEFQLSQNYSLEGFIKTFKLPHEFVKTVRGYSLFLPAVIELSQFYNVDGLEGQAKVGDLLKKFNVSNENLFAKDKSTVLRTYDKSNCIETQCINLFETLKEVDNSLNIKDFTDNPSEYALFNKIPFKEVRIDDDSSAAIFAVLKDHEAKDDVVGYWVPQHQGIGFIQAFAFEENQATNFQMDVQMSEGKTPSPMMFFTP
jgi:hypothetical protein